MWVVLSCSSSSSSVGKQSQLLLKPTEVELGLQVGVEFDKKHIFQNLLIQVQSTTTEYQNQIYCFNLVDVQNNNQDAILKLYNIISKVKCFFLNLITSYGTGEISKEFSPKMKFVFGGQG